MVMKSSWTEGDRLLYQPIHLPELSSWPIVRRCTDRFEMMKASLAQHDVLSGSYLDIGSSYGWFVDRMSKQGYRAFGVDRDIAAIAVGGVAYGLDLSTVTKDDLVNFLSRNKQRYDVVSCFSVLHHYALGKESTSAIDFIRLVDAITGTVLFLDTGEAHEGWFKDTLKDWTPEYIADWLGRHTSFTSIEILGIDEDGKGRYRGQYGRHLFACYRKEFLKSAPVPQDCVAYQVQPKKYAIITPYYQESREVIERCIKSVREQTVAADHILVADGFPQDWFDDSGARHIRLDRCHADYGDTPRGLGAMIAASEGYEAIGFLDADCWLEPDHVQYCLQLASQAGPQGCDYVIALRHERRPDGTLMNIGQVPPDQHVDTSCFFFFKSAFHVLPVWNLIPQEVSIVGDRVFYKAVKENSLRSVIATRKTVNYTCMWASIYQAMGEQPPTGAKPNPDHERVERWINELPANHRAVINRSLQTKLEELYSR
jgi:hypothetical protein